MGKKIVIVSEIFAPENRIAAIRVTKIAKYLYRLCDCEIIIITRDADFEIIDTILQKDIEFPITFIRAKENKILQKIRRSRHKRFKTKLEINNQNIISKNKKVLVYYNTERFKDLVLGILNLINSFSYYRDAKKQIIKKTLEYDVIISSFGPYSSHYIGRFLKRRKKASVWIADFRDPVLNHKTPIGLVFYNKRFAGRVTKLADHITVVSEGVFRGLYIKNRNYKVITNGFDKEDIKSINNWSNKNKLVLAYTGQLYDGKSDLTPVFVAIGKLIEKGLMREDNILLVYAGSSQNDFLSQVGKNKLLDCSKSYSMISREESLKIQNEGDVLLMASWNNKNEEGVITGKVYEYMMMNKPIICTVSGDTMNSAIKLMIDEMDLGICYEEANSEKDSYNLEEYLLRLYNEKMKNGYVTFYPRNELVEVYNYSNLVYEFIELIK